MATEGVHPGLELWLWDCRHTAGSGLEIPAVRTVGVCRCATAANSVWSPFWAGKVHGLFSSCGIEQQPHLSCKVQSKIASLNQTSREPSNAGHLYSVWSFEQLHSCPNIASVRVQHLRVLPHGRVALPGAARHQVQKQSSHWIFHVVSQKESMKITKKTTVSLAPKWRGKR